MINHYCVLLSFEPMKNDLNTSLINLSIKFPKKAGHQQLQIEHQEDSHSTGLLQHKCNQSSLISTHNTTANNRTELLLIICCSSGQVSILYRGRILLTSSFQLDCWTARHWTAGLLDVKTFHECLKNLLHLPHPCCQLLH